MILTIALLGCTGAGPDATRAEPDDSASVAEDSGPADSAADTGQLACPEPFVLRADDAPVAAELDFGAPAARTAAVTRTLTLTNTCARRVRLLGHPDDWVTGDGYTLGDLPSVYVEPGASTSLGVVFSPGAPGDAPGALSLPHDGGDGALALGLRATVGPPLRIVLVGDGAHRLTTADYGSTSVFEGWTTLEPHTAALLRGVCSGAPGFVAVGGNAERVAWTSPDGETWTEHVATGAPIGDCAWGDGQFVGFDGAPVRSADGASWTRGEGSVAHHLRAMTVGADPTGATVFVAVGDAGQIALTADGVSWAHDTTVGEADLRAVVYGGGRFVAAGADGAVAMSEDGGWTWIESSTGGDGVQGLVAVDGGFLLGDGGSVYASSEGVAWELVNSGPAHPLVAVGTLILGTDGARVWTSEDDGFSWTEGAAATGGLSLGDAAVEVRE